MDFVAEETISVARLESGDAPGRVSRDELAGGAHEAFGFVVEDPREGCSLRETFEI